MEFLNVPIPFLVDICVIMKLVMYLSMSLVEPESLYLSMASCNLLEASVCVKVEVSGGGSLGSSLGVAVGLS